MVEQSQDGWFLSYPYGSTYSFPNRDEMLKWLGKETNPHEVYGPVIIAVHVFTSYGHPHVKHAKYTRQDWKRFILGHRPLTQEEKLRALQRLGIEATHNELLTAGIATERTTKEEKIL